MIRPHAEGFYYKEFDFEVMKQTLNSLKSHGADGFVFGILTGSPQKRDPNASWIDVSRNKQLVQLAQGRPCTFHRAFDLIPESHWETALADITECGFASILTNGGPSGTKAMECVDKLKTLVRYQMQLQGGRKLQNHKVPEIIVGGGVRASNISLLHLNTGASAFHSAALLVSEGPTCADEVSKMKDEISRAREEGDRRDNDSTHSVGVPRPPYILRV
ncbi:Copper homeostasis protein CutC [Penicillium robsamsonii]|uniref:Copper homeostasis protein CutC n=1 Tax=Penicillium robsamsonii TaxID=1792511 RepID=UPI0025489226|nr:Copper homeostasis protein CutC [Penicillium robsamsonii]KAJ5813236.1 Copper homeostasis protein CutC [Penicillium robsamsonii]